MKKKPIALFEQDTNKIYGLIAILVLSVIIISSVSIYLLYNISFDMQKSRLSEIVRNQAAIMETIAEEKIKLNLNPGAGKTSDKAYTEIVAMFNKSQQKFAGFGRTGEFTLAKRNGNVMEFVLNRRHKSYEIPGPVPFNSELAEPMRRALTEKKGGIIVGLDYRGVRVLAAYEPVGVFGLGIVAKIDLSEIRAPYIRAAFIIGLFLMIIITAVTISIYRSGNSVILQLRDANEKLWNEIIERTKAEKSLEEAKQELEQNNEELNATNEELSATNEELLATNEEFESAMEEISRSQQEIEMTLGEKETLLRELYHRTKNNMQVVCALLNLQADESNDAAVTEALKDTENRIMSMSLVHQKLYQSLNLSRISLKDYTLELFSHVLRSYGIEESRISVEYHLEDISIPIDTAVPLGLVLNELISNTFKHGFPDNERGSIHLAITLDEKKEIVIHYSDSGVGIPQQYDFENPKTIGIQLILNIVQRQLRGSITVSSGKGFDCEIRFPEKFNQAKA